MMLFKERTMSNKNKDNPVYAALTLTDEYHYFSESARYKLVQRREDSLLRMVDELAVMVPEIGDVLNAIRKVSENWYKTSRGFIMNRYRMNILWFRLHPNQIDDMELLFANVYFIIVDWLRRITKLLIGKYGYENTHYHFFKISRGKLERFSRKWYLLYEREGELIEARYWRLESQGLGIRC